MTQQARVRIGKTTTFAPVVFGTRGTRMRRVYLDVLSVGTVPVPDQNTSTPIDSYLSTTAESNSTGTFLQG